MGNSGITHIEFKNDGFKAILQSDGCREVIEQTANEIADKANSNNTRGGTGFASKTEYGTRAGRYIGFVYSTDKDSLIAETEDGALSGAIL